MESAGIDVHQLVRGGHKDSLVPAPIGPRIPDVAIHIPDREAKLVPSADEVLPLSFVYSRGVVRVGRE